jgi:hypothetical protein
LGLAAFSTLQGAEAFGFSLVQPLQVCLSFEGSDPVDGPAVHFHCAMSRNGTGDCQLTCVWRYSCGEQVVPPALSVWRALAHHLVQRTPRYKTFCLLGLLPTPLRLKMTTSLCALKIRRMRCMQACKIRRMWRMQACVGGQHTHFRKFPWQLMHVANCAGVLLMAVSTCMCGAGAEKNHRHPQENAAVLWRTCASGRQVLQASCSLPRNPLFCNAASLQRGPVRVSQRYPLNVSVGADGSVQIETKAARICPLSIPR